VRKRRRLGEGKKIGRRVTEREKEDIIKGVEESQSLSQPHRHRHTLVYNYMHVQACACVCAYLDDTFRGD
jgi:hypothetical protein